MFQRLRIMQLIIRNNLSWKTCYYEKLVTFLCVLLYYFPQHLTYCRNNKLCELCLKDLHVWWASMWNNNNNNNWFLYSAFLVWNTTQSALQCIITPVTGFNINPALIVYLFNSLGSILARRHFRGAHMPHQATNYVRILLGTHLYTWVESSNVDKVSCWRTKSAWHWRESNPHPFDPESKVQSNIPRHLWNRD